MVTLTGAYETVKLFVRRLLSTPSSKKASREKMGMARFEFRLRFNMLKGDHFLSEDKELELLRTDHGQTIRLRAGSCETPISDSSEIAISGGPYSSESDARNVAVAARASVAVWAVKHRIGVDFGDGKIRSFLTDVGREYFERERGHPIRNDRLGIDVYELREGLRFASTSFEAAVGKSPAIFVEQFREGIIIPLLLSDKQLLAAELYGLSFFDMSFRSRFITLVTVPDHFILRQIKRLPNGGKLLAQTFGSLFSHQKLPPDGLRFDI